MDGMGQELLPRARLARDQDRQVAQRADAQHRVEDRHDGRAFSYTPQLLHHVFDAVLFVPSAGFCLEELSQEAAQFVGKLRCRAVE